MNVKSSTPPQLVAALCQLPSSASTGRSSSFDPAVMLLSISLWVLRTLVFGREIREHTPLLLLLSRLLGLRSSCCIYNRFVLLASYLSSFVFHSLQLSLLSPSFFCTPPSSCRPGISFPNSQLCLGSDCVSFVAFPQIPLLSLIKTQSEGCHRGSSYPKPE